MLYEVITGIHVNQIKSFTSFNKVSSRFKRSVSCRSLDRVMAKYKATFPIGAKSKASKSRKKKEQKKKREKKRIAASESRRTRTCIIFRSLGGEPIDDNYETEACGIPQLETVDLETLSLFKSRTDLACLRDLLNAKCFIGKAHNVVCDFCA